MSRVVHRTSRIELRASPERAERIHFAAELVNQSTSAFVLEAASRRAEEVIAANATTAVPPAFFDRLLSALDEPPRPNARLLRRGSGRRRVVQR